MLESLDTLIAFALIMLVVSLLITVAVQMISALLNLRGRNLARGLRETLKVVCPDLANGAEALTDHVLTGPLISDTAYGVKLMKWSLASAARADEVFDAIHRIAQGRHSPGDATAAQLAALQTNATQLLQVLGVPAAGLANAANAANAVQTADAAGKALQQRALAAIGALPQEQQAEVRQALDGYASQLKSYATHIADNATKGVENAAAAVDQAYSKFQYWYDISQERAQTWFTTHTRLFTVFFAFFFAFALQLDTVEIFKLVSSNKAVRDKLVAHAAAISNEAQKVLGDNSAVCVDALAAFKKEHAAELGGALDKVSIAPTDSREKAMKAVMDALKDKPQLMAGFDSMVDKKAQERLGNDSGQFKALSNALDETGFQLIPSGKGRWGDHWCSNLGSHIAGILCSVALLSLGAPFWFNTLKSLTNLRSAVAKNIDSEADQSSADAVSKPPPTVTKPTPH